MKNISINLSKEETTALKALLNIALMAKGITIAQAVVMFYARIEEAEFAKPPKEEVNNEKNKHKDTQTKNSQT
jgi:hypothetical protein